MAVAVFSWAVVEIKRPLFVLCTVIIGRVAKQMETHFTPNPHTGGGVGGIFSKGIKWLDTLLPLGFGEKQNLVVFSADPHPKRFLCWSLHSAWKSFSVRWSGVYLPQDARLTPPLTETSSRPEHIWKPDIFSNLLCGLIPTDTPRARCSWSVNAGGCGLVISE